MVRTAVLFASGMTGNTKRVAKHIAESVGADLIDLKGTQPDLSGYDRLFIGTGVHAGKPYKPVISLIEKQKDVIAGKESFLFLMCMYNGERGDNQLKRISSELGIADAVYFNQKGADSNGIPPGVDDYIKRVMQ